MAEVITKTVVEIEKLGLFWELDKAYTDAGLAKKWESATFDEATRKVSFYTVPQPSGDVEPVFTFTLPEVDFTEVYAAIEAVEAKADKNAEDIAAITNAETGILKQAKDYADGKDEAIAAAKKAGDDAQVDVDALEEVVAGMYTNGQIDTAVADAKKAGTDAQSSVDTLAGKVGEVPEDKTVVQMIADAKAEATYDDTQVKADIAANTKAIEDEVARADAAEKANKELIDANATAINTEKERAMAAEKANADAIALLNDGSTVEGSVDYKIAQAVAAIMENPDETMNSINELVTWINGHAEDALELSNKVTANEGAIADLEALVGTEGVAKQITDAIAEALTIDGVDKYALATDLTAAIARIATLESKAHEHANKDVLDGITAEKVTAWDISEQNAKDYADGLNTTMNGRVETVEGAVEAAQTDATSALEKIDAIKYATEDDIRNLFL